MSQCLGSIHEMGGCRFAADVARLPERWLWGAGRYDNVVARIIPSITSKIITQIIMNISFCKIKKNINLQGVKGKRSLTSFPNKILLDLEIV